ncbi:hypothetical protein ACH4S8_37815 [Streptomyces sp. NPDC021080]|uniref:hypothetical protein n=1 Tax=Streptomyces sp. NPDC021080 TaxID=3365110 RepID=UPI0037A7161C
MTTFRPDSKYYGWAHQPAVGENEQPTVSLSFSALTEVYGGSLPTGVTAITPAMVADALNDLLDANGWPPITFLGTPVDETLS